MRRSKAFYGNCKIIENPLLNLREGFLYDRIFCMVGVNVPLTSCCPILHLPRVALAACRHFAFLP